MRLRAPPALLMGAGSADLPAVQLVGGPMLPMDFHGERLGACTDCRRFWASFRGDQIDAQEIAEVNNQLVASVGTCSVMGTASTMACIAEALGMSLPGAASPPAVTPDRIRIAERSGAQAMKMIEQQLTPDRILTGKSIENALRVLLAIGGSTNGLVHLTAAAGRLGIKIDLAEFDKLGREVPVLLDLKPSGKHYMEHFHWAGGVPRLLRVATSVARRASGTSARRGSRRFAGSSGKYMRVASCFSRPRMNTPTTRWGACGRPFGPGTAPGLMVVNRKTPRSSVGMRPNPRKRL